MRSRARWLGGTDGPNSIPIRTGLCQRRNSPGTPVRAPVLLYSLKKTICSKLRASIFAVNGVSGPPPSRRKRPWVSWLDCTCVRYRRKAALCSDVGCGAGGGAPRPAGLLRGVSTGSTGMKKSQAVTKPRAAIAPHRPAVRSTCVIFTNRPLAWHCRGRGVAHPVLARLGRGQRVAQIGFHFLEVLLGSGAFGLALVGDPKAVLDGANEVGIGLFDRFDVEHAPLHFGADRLVALA
mmetsp:Transcript_97/g.266  ORF Transcript_97/g.266 Transcript_97/m.266 type:complete len:236 (-) Transcript_97:407-1114(-)